MCACVSGNSKGVDTYGHVHSAGMCLWALYAHVRCIRAPAPHVLAGSIRFYMNAEPLSHLENNPFVCDFLMVTVLLHPPVTCTHGHTYPTPLRSR